MTWEDIFMHAWQHDMAWQHGMAGHGKTYLCVVCETCVFGVGMKTPHGRQAYGMVW